MKCEACKYEYDMKRSWAEKLNDVEQPFHEVEFVYDNAMGSRFGDFYVCPKCKTVRFE